jgi:hypothetical protein
MRVSSQLLTKLRYDQLEDIEAATPAGYIKQLQNDVLKLAIAIQEGYFVTV